jgi:hypothetical protein
VDELGIDKRELKEGSNFNSRLKLQKVCFLLGSMGKSPFNKLNFNLYLRGPYSPSLATQYYDLNGDHPEPITLTRNEHETLEWFTHLDLRQMEVASSIILIQGFGKGKMPDEDIYSVLTVSKPWVEKDDFQRMIGELRKKGLVK